MFTLWLCNVYTNKPVNEMVPVLEMEAVLDQIFFLNWAKLRSVVMAEINMPWQYMSLLARYRLTLTRTSYGWKMKTHVCSHRHQNQGGGMLVGAFPPPPHCFCKFKHNHSPFFLAYQNFWCLAPRPSHFQFASDATEYMYIPFSKLWLVHHSLHPNKWYTFRSSWF